MRSNTIFTLCATLTLTVGCGDSSGDAGDGYTTTSVDGSASETDGGDGDSGDGDSGDGDSGDGDSGSTGDIDIDPDNMIDNFEDGDGALIPNGGRQGYWYIFNDETEGATQTPDGEVLPVEGGSDGTAMAMNTAGSGFTEWGAGIGIDLNNEGGGMEGGNGIKMTYDSSAYAGVVLTAKGNGQIRAMVQIEATIPPEEGGTCAVDCDPHGKVLLLSDEWQQFTLPFDQLNQEGWGTPAAWDSATVVGLQFKVGASTDFDFWIDEVGFY